MNLWEVVRLDIKIMKLLYGVMIGLLFCSQLAAQEIEIASDSVSRHDTLNIALLTDVMEHVVVHQDTLIRELMLDKRLGRQRGQQELSGFRVQVYSSNQQQVAKNEAISLQEELKNKLDHPVYVLSEPPFWKVRIGDFLKREDANAYKEELLEQFPDLYGSTYVVPDKVTILY